MSNPLSSRILTRTLPLRIRPSGLTFNASLLPGRKDSMIFLVLRCRQYSSEKRLTPVSRFHLNECAAALVGSPPRYALYVLANTSAGSP
ncbi:MAG TPA: hypothetical protein VF766_00165, partial [Pyrinomonadaceae bacterium]